EYVSFQMRTTLGDGRVSDIMAPPVGVNKGTTIADLVNQFVFHYHDRIFPVVDRGRFIGMIDIQKLKKVPTADWPNTYIDAYMSEPPEYCILEPETDTRTALRLLTESVMPKAPVLAGDALVGSLTRKDLAEVIALKSDLAA